MEEEVFGGVLRVEWLGREEEVIEVGKDRIYGLGGGVWWSDMRKGERVGRELRLGRVWMNDLDRYLVEGGWGGYKE